MAKCRLLYPSDASNIIRLDGILRNNAGASLEDSVSVTRVETTPAKDVAVVPLDDDVPHLPNGYLAYCLQGMGLAKNDTFIVPWNNGRLAFQAVRILPDSEAALISPDTLFTDYTSDEWLGHSKPLPEEVPRENVVSSGELSSDIGCALCGKPLTWFDKFTCYYCKQTFCSDHRVPETHKCVRVIIAREAVEKDMLREKGVNITTGEFAVYCHQCADYVSGFMEITRANQERLNHIARKGCPPQKVKLRRSETDLVADRGQSNALPTTGARTAQSTSTSEDWMQTCLEEAKNAITSFHSPFCNCDSKMFFGSTSYELYIQNDRPNVYAYIQIGGRSSHFPIGVHPVFTERTPYYERALVVVLIHELLHAVHPDWSHDRILPQEKLLANKAGYFDALIELQRLAVSGKMRFCSN